MKEITLYIDESGNLGTGCGRYFLICALEIDNNIKSTISKRAGRIICRYKIKKGISKTKELKGTDLNNDDRNDLIDKILFKGIKVHYIVLDLNHATFLLKKADVNRIEFNINYLESDSNYLIQWADIIANSLYKKYNSDNNDYYKKIKPYIVFKSEFPTKLFGK